MNILTINNWIGKITKLCLLTDIQYDRLSKDMMKKYRNFSQEKKKVVSSEKYQDNLGSQQLRRSRSRRSLQKIVEKDEAAKLRKIQAHSHSSEVFVQFFFCYFLKININSCNGNHCAFNMKLIPSTTKKNTNLPTTHTGRQLPMDCPSTNFPDVQDVGNPNIVFLI